MLVSCNMLSVNLKQKCPELNYKCTTIFGNSLHRLLMTTATCRSLFYSRGNTYSVWMFSFFTFYCFWLLAKSFWFQFKVKSKQFMVMFTEHVSTLLWGRDHKKIACRASGLIWLQRWGSSTWLFLPESPPHSDENADLKRGRQEEPPQPSSLRRTTSSQGGKKLSKTP